jgi:hypothetical protein
MPGERGGEPSDVDVSNCHVTAMAVFKLAISAPAVSAPQLPKNRKFSLVR